MEAKPTAKGAKSMSENSSGINRRANIDTEVVRGLLIANGGGAVALLAFLPVVFDRTELYPIARPAIWSLLIFQLGVFSAVLHNHLRSKCSAAYQNSQSASPSELADTLLCIIKLKEPKVCVFSKITMWLSLTMFLTGGVVVFLGALTAVTPLDDTPESEAIEEIADGN